MKLRFPSGKIGNRIRRWGFGEQHLEERPQMAQDMMNSGKCELGKVIDYSREELDWLKLEVENAVDIGSCQVEDHKRAEWGTADQKRLKSFYTKLVALYDY